MSLSGDTVRNNQHANMEKEDKILGLKDSEVAAEGVDDFKPIRKDGKIELTEVDAYDNLGYCFPSWKKWMILWIIPFIQTSMNTKASMYGNAVDGLTENSTFQPRWHELVK